MNKNWSFDLHVGFLKLNDMATVCETKSDLTYEFTSKKNYKL